MEISTVVEIGSDHQRPAGSRSYDDLDSAEVCGVAGDRVTGDSDPSSHQTEPCRQDGPARVAWLTEMSDCPCVHGLLAAAEAWCIAISIVVAPVVVAGVRGNL